MIKQAANMMNLLSLKTFGPRNEQGSKLLGHSRAHHVEFFIPWGLLGHLMGKVQNFWATQMAHHVKFFIPLGLLGHPMGKVRKFWATQVPTMRNFSFHEDFVVVEFFVHWTHVPYIPTKTTFKKCEAWKSKLNSNVVGKLIIKLLNKLFNVKVNALVKMY